MQFGNDPAITFYKKYGFDILEEIKDFYTDIEPRDCYFMRRDMHKEIDLERDMNKEVDLEKT